MKHCLILFVLLFSCSDTDIGIGVGDGTNIPSPDTTLGDASKDGGGTDADMTHPECEQNEDPCTISQVVCEDGTCTCVEASSVNGTECVADPNACTEGDSCQEGLCVQGEPAELDDGNECTAGVCVKGEIVQTLLSGPCSDGNPCTIGDSCALGQCVPDANKECPGGPCTEQGFCDPDVGDCVYDFVADGTACDSIIPCADNATCQAGQCIPDALAPCSDGNPCTLDLCSESGCENPNAVDGTPCPDADPCNGEESCSSGFCVPALDQDPCDDDDPCTSDLCLANGDCENTDIEGCGAPPLSCGAMSAHFTGDNCIAVSGINQLSDDFTIEFWFHPLTDEQTHFIIDKAGNTLDDSPGFRVRYLSWLLSNGEKKVIHYEEKKTPSNYHGLLAQNYYLNTWRHYVIERRSNGLIRSYIDGVQQGASSFNNASFLSDQSNDEVMYIGCEDGSFNFLEGYIDELRITEGIRYTQSFSPPSEPFSPDSSTVALYHFDEGDGSTIFDSSGSELHGTWIGAGAWWNGSPVELGVLCGSSCCSAGESCVSGQCTSQQAQPSIIYSDLLGNNVYQWSQQDGSSVIGNCNQPAGIAFLPPSSVFAACVASDTVELMDFDGTQTQLFQSTDVFFNPNNLALSTDGTLYVSSSIVISEQLHTIDLSDNSFASEFTVDTQECQGLGFGSDGTLYWADSKGDGRVYAYDASALLTGTPQTVIASLPTGFDVQDMHVGANDKLYLIGSSLSTPGGVRVYDTAGSFEYELDLPEAGRSISVDQQGQLYVLVTGSAPGVYRHNGATWDLLFSHDSGVGDLIVLD